MFHPTKELLSQKRHLFGFPRNSSKICYFFNMSQNVAINKNFVYFNRSCSNLNYALPDMSTTTPENCRQNGAGTWEEIDYIQTYRQTTGIHPLSHTLALCTQSISSNFSYPFHTRFARGLDKELG